MVAAFLTTNFTQMKNKVFFILKNVLMAFFVHFVKENDYLKRSDLCTIFALISYI